MAAWQQRISAGQRQTLFLVYRASWWIAFAAALALTVVVSAPDEIATQAKYRAFMAIGISAFWNPSVQGQYGAPFGAPGAQAGIRFGDLVTAIDGRPMPPDTAGRVAALAFSDGQRVTITARRPDGQVYTTHVVRSSRYERDAYAGWHISFSGQRWAVFTVNMIANLASLAAALLLFLRRPRDPVAAILTLALLTAPLTSPNIATTITGVGGVIAAAISFFVPTLAVLFFPDGRLATRWHWLALVLAVANLLAGFVPDLSLEYASYLYLLGYGESVAVVVAVWAQFRLTPPGAARQQIKFVLLGVVIAMLLNVVSSFIDSLVTLYAMPVGPIAWLSLAKWTIFGFGNLAIPAGLLVSLTRYRLYDADSVISRSVVYATLTLALLAIFAGSEKMIEILGEHYFGGRLGALASGVGAGFAALMIAPLHHRVNHWAEHRFQGNLVHLRNSLPMLVRDMSATATTQPLAAAILARVAKGVRARHGAIVVDREVIGVLDIDADAAQAWVSTGQAPPGDDGQLHTDRDDPLLPMRVPLYADSVGLVGWLLLGPRLDGSFYGKDERETLLTIAGPVARALFVTSQRSERDGARAREIGGIVARLTSVETRLTDFAAQPIS